MATYSSDMAYQVLARKWRPQDFHALVGQEHVLRALIHSLDEQRLHHAYLFSGTRGVGKTTIARILARCLNCEEGVSSTPCGTCSSCTEISEGRFVDLIEVDAASRTKVEDTRELLENVQYAPTRGRYKVYLIDEVHMLSTSSFNALLKTLEEPPPHVKFLLATTDPQKLPVTVLSRCLQFNLKNMHVEQVSEYLQDILSQEQISFDNASLWQLGRAAKGSMRDALSLTDQAISFCGGEITESAVNQMLGSIDQSRVVALVEALRDNASAKILQLVGELADQGQNFTTALEDLLALLHQVAVCQVVNDAPVAVQFNYAEIKQLAEQMTAADVQLFYQMGVQALIDLDKNPDTRSGLEMALLRMLAFRPQISPQQMQFSTAPNHQQTHSDVAASVAPVIENSASELEIDSTELDTTEPPHQTTDNQPLAPQEAPAPQAKTSPADSTTDIPPVVDVPPWEEASKGWPATALKTATNKSDAPKLSSQPDQQQPDYQADESQLVDDEIAQEPERNIIAKVPTEPDVAESNAKEASVPELDLVEPGIARPEAQQPFSLGPAEDPVNDVEDCLALVSPDQEASVLSLDQVPTQQSSQNPPVNWTLADLDETNWPRIFVDLQIEGLARAIASNMVFVRRNGTQLTFTLEQSQSSMLNVAHQGRMRQALETMFGCDLQLAIDIGPSVGETPQARHERQVEEQQQQAIEALRQDPNLQQLKEAFSGSLDESTIKPVNNPDN